MKTKRTTHIVLLFLAAAAHAGLRSSAGYSITTDTADIAGRRAVSADYSHDGGAGMIAGGSANAAPMQSSKHGYVGQLYDVMALELSAPALTLNETATLQLGAALVLDDSTLLALAPASVAWSVESGPLAAIAADGLATAGVVFQNTDAKARGTHAGFTGALTLSVLNVTTDDFGSYAGDGIGDDWQVQYFGFDNPLAAPGVDFTGNGQTNLFNYVAGLDPTDPGAIFRLRIEQVPGEPARRAIVFKPRLEGRDYTVRFRDGLGVGDWIPLVNFMTTDDGDERTVTDLDAGGPVRFYDIEITKP